MVKTGQLTEDDFSKITNAANEIYKGNLLIDDSSGLTDMELRSRVRRMKHEYNVELVIVDYIGQMRSYRKTENRQQEVSEISKALKAIAKDFQIPIIAVAQINRGPEDRSDKRPLLSDLRESGSIEQDADTVCLLYRDSYYNKNAEDDTTEVIVAKQRNGPIGTIKLDFNKKCVKFENQVR
jgi:replicative DNA helicase